MSQENERQKLDRIFDKTGKVLVPVGIGLVGLYLLYNVVGPSIFPVNNIDGNLNSPHKPTTETRVTLPFLTPSLPLPEIIITKNTTASLCPTPTPFEKKTIQFIDGDSFSIGSFARTGTEIEPLLSLKVSSRTRLADPQTRIIDEVKIEDIKTHETLHWLSRQNSLMIAMILSASKKNNLTEQTIQDITTALQESTEQWKDSMNSKFPYNDCTLPNTYIIESGVYALTEVYTKDKHMPSPLFNQQEAEWHIAQNGPLLAEVTEYSNIIAAGLMQINITTKGALDDFKFGIVQEALYPVMRTIAESTQNTHRLSSLRSQTR